MSEIQIKVINHSNHDLPNYQTQHAAGLDVYASLAKPLTLGSLERVVVDTGLFIALPPGYEAQIRPRSGLAINHGISVINTPGTIDADYRGELKILLINLSHEAYTVQDGERIAQMVIARHERVVWEIVDELDETDRGSGGFGHTG